MVSSAMIARRVLAGSLVLGALIVSPGAAAKAFRQGDVSLCNAHRCLPINDQPVLNSLAAFYYDPGERPTRSSAPSSKTASLELEFSNRYVTGIVGGVMFDRFRSGGVNLDQFQPGVWYRLPAPVARGLRTLAAGLTSTAGSGRQPSAPLIAVFSLMVGVVIITLARRRPLRAPAIGSR
jgi:hypothetical protein